MALMLSLLFHCFPLFLPHLTQAQEKKVTKLSLFWNWWAKSLFVSIIVAKYDIFSSLTMAACAKNFWQSDLLTLSACTIGILSTLTYTEFDCVALLPML